jgi:hypothetical protein
MQSLRKVTDDSTNTTTEQEHKKTTREKMGEYCKAQYSWATQTLRSPGISLSGARGESHMKDGDEHFKNKRYTAAATYYNQARCSAYHLPEALFQLGLCVLNGAREEAATIPVNGKTMSTNDLAAFFFREILFLMPDYNEKELNQPKVRPCYTDAIYQLSQCIAKGATLDEVDFVNTPFENQPLETIDREKLREALLQRVVTIKPDHEEARKDLFRDSTKPTFAPS